MDQSFDIHVEAKLETDADCQSDRAVSKKADCDTLWPTFARHRLHVLLINELISRLCIQLNSHFICLDSPQDLVCRERVSQAAQYAKDHNTFVWALE